MTLSGQLRRAASSAAAAALRPRPRRNSRTAAASGSRTTALSQPSTSVIENCSPTMSTAVSASKLKGSPQPRKHLGELWVVVSARGAGHEYSPGPQYPCNLSEDDRRLGHVVEHPERCDCIETAVDERQSRRVSLDRGRRRVTHISGAIHNDGRNVVAYEQTGQCAVSATKIKNTAAVESR